MKETSQKSPGFSSRPPAVQAMLAVLALLVSILIIVPRIATTIQSTDGPEFAYLSVLGGLAHPPGYPLYTILCSIAVSIFSANPYFTISALSAMATIISILLLGLICTRLSRTPEIGWLFAITWGTLPVVLDVATDADVFALHHLFVIALVAAVCLRRREVRPPNSYFLVTGILFGLGLAHHLMMILWAPMILALLIDCRAGFKRSLLTLAGVALGYSSILLIIYRFQTNPSLSLAPVSTPAEFIVCILRLGYGIFSSGISDQVQQQRWLFPFLVWLGRRAPVLLLGLAALPVLIVKGSVPMRGMVCSAILHLLFCWQLTSEVGLTDLSWIGRFFGAPALSLMLLCASSMRFTGFRLPVLTIFLLNFWLFPENLVESNRRENLSSDRQVRDMLARAPEHAVFLTSSDLLGFGGIYLQKIERLRPDLLLVHDSRLGSPHYRQVLNIQLKAIDPNWASVPETLEGLTSELCGHQLIAVAEAAPDKNLCSLPPPPPLPQATVSPQS